MSIRLRVSSQTVMAPAVSRERKKEEAARKARKCGQVKGAPSDKHLCLIGVQSSGCFSSGASLSHFPVSHHPSSKERACNYPFSTWVPDSPFVSEPRLHLTRAAPSPALRGESPCRPTAQSLCGFPFCPSSSICDSEADFE